MENGNGEKGMTDTQQLLLWLIPLGINFGLIMFLASKNVRALKVWDPNLDQSNTPQQNTRLILTLAVLPILNIVFMWYCLEYIYIRFIKGQS